MAGEPTELVRGVGLEPTCPKAHAPQTCASTNSATRAENLLYILHAPQTLPLAGQACASTNSATRAENYY